MSKGAVIFFLLAVGVLVVSGLPTLVGDLSTISNVRSQRPASNAVDRPTFDPEAPRTAAPQIGFTDETGRTRYLGDFQGQVLLINFWATWCDPCRREMPSLMRLEQALSGTGFRLITISTDQQGAAVVQPFLEAHGLGGMPAYYDPDRLAYGHFGAAAIPTSILIDRRGREIGRYLGWAQWDNPATVAHIREFVRR